MGNDYYVTNEHRVFADGRTIAAGEVFGYDEITWQYYSRYRLPVMHTETNFAQGPNGDEAVYWLWKEWANVLRVRNDGIPVVGFTWYSLTDQVDWDSALREDNGTVNALGLFDLNRRIRPVGQAFQKLVAEWGDVLPTQSVCLRVPVYPARHSHQAAQLGSFMRRAIAPDNAPMERGNSTSTGSVESVLTGKASRSSTSRLLSTAADAASAGFPQPTAHCPAHGQRLLFTSRVPSSASHCAVFASTGVSVCITHRHWPSACTHVDVSCISCVVALPE
jgi:hypothetical protein